MCHCFRLVGFGGCLQFVIKAEHEEKGTLITKELLGNLIPGVYVGTLVSEVFI